MRVRSRKLFTRISYPQICYAIESHFESRQWFYITVIVSTFAKPLIVRLFRPLKCNTYQSYLRTKAPIAFVLLSTAGAAISWKTILTSSSTNRNLGAIMYYHV